MIKSKEHKLYCFTNKQYEQLCDAIINGNQIEQMFCLQKAQMRKAIENDRIRKRTNKMRKTNKYYGRPKPKQQELENGRTSGSTEKE